VATPTSKEECYFWDGKNCQFEMLVLGCRPCGHCPPEPDRFLEWYKEAHPDNELASFWAEYGLDDLRAAFAAGRVAQAEDS
jgi:hypothetical protein